MEQNIRVQIYIFLFTLYGGLIIGILYDVIDILLHGESKKTKGRGITDILFWMLAMVVVLGILFYSNDGNVRVYTLMGFAVGWLLYFLLLSKWIRKVFFFIMQLIVTVVKAVIAAFLIPCRGLKAIIYKPFMKIHKKGNNMKNQLARYFHIPKIIGKQFRKYKKYLSKKN